MGSSLREAKGACGMAGLPGAGAAFGRYDLVRRIGRGGMGVVYEATHRDLQRPVALKLLSMDLLDNEALRNRFIREAQALAAVDSPMIVSVFDAGEHDGWLYIATKLYPDGDLGEWIHEHGALSLEESVSVLAQVAEGLADAHESGFLHRDIKPSNILLQRRPGGLRAVICDFGIAFAEGSEHTKTVGVIGTLGYMAPERHEGLPATAASDIYSLGCVLYACLEGRAPYGGTDVKVAMGHLYNPVPQIAEGTDAVNGVLLRALAKNPEDRYRSAAEFRQALLRLTEPEESTVIVDFAPGAPPSARPTVEPERTHVVPDPRTSVEKPAEDDTVVPRATTVGAVHPPLSPAPPSGSGFSRRQKAWIAGAIAAVVAVGIGTVAALTSSGDDRQVVRPETLSLEVVGDCQPSTDGCSRVQLSATGLPADEMVLVRTIVNGAIDRDGCDYDDGTVKPCFSGRTTGSGELEVQMDWAFPADLEVQLGGFSASATVR